MAELDPLLFRRLAELAADPMVAHRDGLLVWANAAAARLAEVTDPDAMVGRPVHDFVPAYVPEAPAPGGERTIHLADGRPVHATVARWQAEDGTVVVAVRDRAPENQQRTAEARARAFFDASRAALGISRLGVHVEVNPAYATLFGFDSPDQLPGVPILDLIDPSEHDRIKDFVRRRAAGEGLPDAYVTVGRRRDGSSFPLRVSASSYVDAGVVTTIVVMADASEEDRQRQRERLAAIGRLAGGVAHDFNNLLATMLGSAELALLQEPPDAPARESIQRVVEAAHAAAQLVRQILALGGKDAGEPGPVDLRPIVTEAASLARAALPPGVTLRTTTHALSGTVVADRGQVLQILLNLAMNARDAVGDAGTVTLALDEQDGPPQDPALAGRRWARLQVTDDGAGIDPRVQGSLFEPYASTKGVGRGLGLAVVHGIVQSLGGVVRVDSAAGRGTRFEVWLPLSPLSAAGAAKPAPRDAGPRRLLVVDDQDLVRQTLARLAESLGFAVTTASDATSALERLAEGRFDLLLSDVSMPGRSGIELAAVAHERWPGLRIVLCSGFADAIDPATVSAAAVERLLPKPVSRAQLAEALGAAP